MAFRYVNSFGELDDYKICNREIFLSVGQDYYLAHRLKAAGKQYKMIVIISSADSRERIRSNVVAIYP